MLACTRLALHKGKDMNVIEVGDTFNCDCGFSWRRGQSGSHNCGDGLRKQIAELKQKLDAVLAENFSLLNFDADEFTESGPYQCDNQILEQMKTPATDALLNAVRAEGAGLVGQALAKIPMREMPISGQRHHYIQRSEAILTADDIAAHLRAETDTTSSQYESLAGGK